MRLPEPPHVCFLTGEYPPMRGGVGDYTRLIARALAGLGYRCSVITGRGARAAAARREPLDPAVYPAIDDWGWASWPHLAALIDDLRPDLLHVQYQTGAFAMRPALNLLPLRLRLASARVPIALTYHDLKVPYLFPKAGPLRPLANALLQATASAVVVTNFEDLVQVVGRDRLTGPPPWPDRSGRRKVDLIPIGSNIEARPVSAGDRAAARARLGLGADEFAVGYFGFVDPWKGVDRLLEALPRVRAPGRPVRLVMVGGARAGPPTPYEATIAARAEAAALGPVVRTGYAPADETSAYLTALDCIALPFQDGACFRHGTLAAAIAHALPIVTTRPAVEGLPSGLRPPPLEHGRDALLVERGQDPAPLAAALAALADSPELRARLRAGAAALASHFTWPSIARASGLAYERALGSARSVGRLDPARRARR